MNKEPTHKDWRHEMKSYLKKISMVTIAVVFGLSALAFADWGGGYGHMMGPGWHRGWDGGDDLSADQIAKLEQQRTEFFKATEGLRQQLYDKELALQSELAKDAPDAGKASALQSDISRLRAELDQKRLEFDLQAGQSLPGYGRGRGYGHMMGYGYGPPMGYGHRGGGYCAW
jgi:zinc resistance-associated protein